MTATLPPSGLVFQGEIAFRTARVAWYAIDRPALE
jgi:hypothetical protein